jgi:mannose-6-phosphate isomerase-like protein (cupin superfamily)
MGADQSGVARAGDAFLVLSDLVTFKVTDADSNGRLTVVQIDVPPEGGPPPMHIHPPDELFTVVSGTVTVLHGDPAAPVVREVAAGECVHVPGGTAHTFRNFTGEPARMLLTFAPGVMMERFFVEVGHPVDDPHDLPQLDLASEVPRVFAASARLGMQMLDVPALP